MTVPNDIDTSLITTMNGLFTVRLAWMARVTNVNDVPGILLFVKYVHRCLEPSA